MARTTFTAPNGETRTSKTMNFNCALVLFNPANAVRAPYVKSWHSGIDLAQKESARWGKRGYRFLIVPVNKEGRTDSWIAAEISKLRTAEDILNIPEQEIDAARAEVAHAEESCAYFEDFAAEGPDGVLYSTQESLNEFLAQAQADLGKKRENLAAVIAEYAPLTPSVKEPTVAPKKAVSRLSRKSQFVKDVAASVAHTNVESVFVGATDHGYTITVERGSDLYTALVITDEKGNSFEIRHPFVAKNVKKVAAVLWDLMVLMAV